MSCEAEANDGIKESEMVPEKDDTDMLIEAMRKAEKAFQAHLESEGIEPAYFALELNGFQLDDNFQEPVKKVSMPAQFQTIKEFSMLGKIKKMFICDMCDNSGIVMECDVCKKRFCVECFEQHQNKEHREHH